VPALSSSAFWLLRPPPGSPLPSPIPFFLPFDCTSTDHTTD
jgi:hypothetical protein